MKKILEQLADKILADMRKSEFESQVFDVSKDEYFICGSYDIEFEWEDQSFSHEFGIEECGVWKLSAVIDISVDWFGWFDEHGEEHELKITNEQIIYIIDYINKKL